MFTVMLLLRSPSGSCIGGVQRNGRIGFTLYLKVSLGSGEFLSILSFYQGKMSCPSFSIVSRDLS